MLQVTIIFDMEGLSFRQLSNKQGYNIHYSINNLVKINKRICYVLAMDVAVDFVKMLQNAYPELLRCLFVVNGTYFFFK